ncbi:FkbM family methyltransferase [Luteolibacter sp. Populi]|uniref:FkbM family methyltransferase n=1 Tax=Luteolibacter sp. Populi TaxID=3230487 RepID=UPI00346530AB
MTLIEKVGKGLRWLTNRGLRGRHISVPLADKKLTLDLRWKHEFDYLEFAQNRRINGAIGLDVWTFGTLVKPGHTVLDAGANIGFTALLADIAGAAEIHCFEPDPRLAKRLEQNCSGNHFTVHPKALGESSGQLDLYLSEKHNQGSTSNRTMIDKFPTVFGKAERVQVEVTTVDEAFPGKHFDFFKVDVEGAEFAMLKGATKHFESHPPSLVYVEVFDEFRADVFNFLGRFYKHGYQVGCDTTGEGRLFRINEPLGPLDRANVHLNPPSFVFSLEDLDPLTRSWTKPPLLR